LAKTRATNLAQTKVTKEEMRVPKKQHLRRKESSEVMPTIVEKI
jgi:hypothetical protein